MAGLELKPISLKVANEFVGRFHSHHKATVGHKFSIGCPADGGETLSGVVIVDRPVSRYLDDEYAGEKQRMTERR